MNSEAIPDIHYKMSKKIAQLTKVIYHLNTKNEDNNFELETLKSQHQVEIQQLLNDSTNKLAKLKEIIDSKQSNVRIYIYLRLIYIYH